MLPYRDSRITYIALGLFFLIVIGYAYYEAQGILFGPTITISSQPAEVDTPFVLIKGTAARISSLTMNGNIVPVTETGAFEQPYLLAPGYNRILLEATDKYERKSERVVEMVLSQNPPPTDPVPASAQSASAALPSLATTTSPDATTSPLAP